MAIAIVNFRTMANGGYKWIKRGQRRGYWRVLIVADPAGCLRVNCHNVLSVPYEGPAGIDGMTPRSAYCIDGSAREAKELAACLNREALARAMLAHYSPTGL